MPKYILCILSVVVFYEFLEAQEHNMGKENSISYKHTAKASMQSRFLIGIYKLIALKKADKKELGAGNPMTRPQPIRKIKRLAKLTTDSIADRAYYKIQRSIISNCKSKFAPKKPVPPVTKAVFCMIYTVCVSNSF